MIIKNVSSEFMSSWKNISPFRCKSLMTKMSGDASGPQTTSPPPGSSPSFAPCPWGSMRVPIFLIPGWNQIQFNLSDFTRRAYGSNYIETLRVTIHANCRIRRIYFSDRLYSEEELPPEFKLFLPIQKQQWWHWFFVGCFLLLLSSSGILWKMFYFFLSTLIFIIWLTFPIPFQFISIFSILVNQFFSLILFWKNGRLYGSLC